MSTLSKRSFSGGEIAPALYARVDITKYTTGARLLKNFYVLKHGGAANRPGSSFVSQAGVSSSAVRLFPFIFSASQTYILEFGENYFRVIDDGNYLYATTTTVTAITKANPAVVTYSGVDNLSNGDEIYLTGVEGMTEVSNRSFRVANVNTGANTFELQDLSSVDIDSSAYTTYTSGGTASEVYEVATDYAAADLSLIRYVQSADVITLVHPSYPPKELSRVSITNWTLVDIAFSPETLGPTLVSVTGGAAGPFVYRYAVTAISKDNLEESLPGTIAIDTITGITAASPAVITTTGTHGLLVDTRIYLDGIVGMTELNKRTFRVSAVTATTITLANEDSSAYTAYSSGGTVAETSLVISGKALPISTNPIAITWSATDSTIQEYNVYKEVNGVFGLIGVSANGAFQDIGVSPDTTAGPPFDRVIFRDTGDYPSTVTYIQQRLAFANTINDPEKIFMSRIGDFKNFTFRSPIQADDSLTFTMAGREVNEVKHLLDLNTFVIFTSGGEFVAGGDSSGTIRPTSINIKQQTYNGSSDLAPLTIDSSALYVQAQGSIVRDLGFSFEQDGYSGNDVTIFATHLFRGYTLSSWTFSQVPDNIVWAVRDDGILLGLTYVKDQQVLAWHQHEFAGGLVEDVISVPEENEDRLYLVIKRTIDGVSRRYIERLTQRQINNNVDVIDLKFMDSALSFDGRNTTVETMTLSGGTNWVYTESLTLTASTATFKASDVGNEIHYTYNTDDILRCEIIAYTSTTVVTVRPHKTVPVALQSTASTAWAKAVDSVSGLWHLEGEQVSIFADRFVVSNPNNTAYDTVTVTDGAVTLADNYTVIHVGLPVTADIETLNIDTVQGETIVDKKQKIGRVSMFVEETRGLFVGNAAPTGSDILEGLQEVKVRNIEDYDDPIALKTGIMDVIIRPEWNSNGRMFIRQTDPIPATILALAPAGNFPLKGGS